MVHIIADTTAGLSQDLLDKYHIPLVPQIINFGNESFLEGSEMDAAMFTQRLASSKALPKTAAPPPEMFVEHFARLASDGQPILCIHPSSKVSGTVRSAMIARQEFPEADIRIMDTQAIDGPLGWMVRKAAEWAAEGTDAETIWQRLLDMTGRMRLYFTVDTLEFLQRGGRIGGAKALVANLLQIKPVLTWRNGQVEPFVSERTRKRALEHLVRLAIEQAPRDGEPMFSVGHAAAPDVAEEIAERLKAEFGEVQIMVSELGPAIVTHGGPGTFSLGFFA